MGENSGSIGTKDISKRYPVSSDSGVGENQYHKDREINLVAQEGSTVSKKVKDTL